MKVFKKILCTFLIVVMCLTSAPLQGFVGMQWPSLPQINFGEFELPKIDLSSWFGEKASATDESIITGQCGDNAYYTYNTETQELVVSGSGDIWDYEMEESPASYTHIESIIIEEGITRIGDNAFLGCIYLKNVAIPDSVTSIGDTAFYYCRSLTNIEIPASVTSIGFATFSECDSLNNITVALDNEYYVNDEYGVLFSKDKSILIQYPIGNQRTYYDIPNGVSEIATAAFFMGVNLVTVFIPSTVSYISEMAFYGCDYIENICYSDTEEQWNAIEICEDNDSLFNANIEFNYFEHSHEYIAETTKEPICGEEIEITYTCTTCGRSYIEYIPKTHHKDDDNNGYCDNCNLEATESGLIGDNINWGIFGDQLLINGSGMMTESIYHTFNSPFKENNNIKSLIIGEDITSIGYRAFYNCQNLEEIIIPDSIMFIGSGAFYATAYYNNSDNWKDGVLYIGKHLIKAKDSFFLPDFYRIKGGTLTIADDAFGGTSLTNITIPDSVISIGIGAFSESELANIALPDNITFISDGLFFGCENLNEITIPESVTDIGRGAFAYSGLTDIKLTDSITSISEISFYGCENLTEVLIPNSVTSIYYGAFAKSGLTDITLSDSLISIGGATFWGCEALENIVIPSSVITIGGEISDISELMFPNLFDNMDDGVFSDCSKLKTISVAENNAYYSSDDYGVLFNKDKTLLITYPRGNTRDSYTIPNSVKFIDDYAFDMCQNLLNITMGNRVETIGDEAFNSCINATMNIPDSVTSIGDGAFVSCWNLESISVGEGLTYIGRGAFYNSSMGFDVLIKNIASWCNIDFVKSEWSEGIDYDWRYLSNPLTRGAKLYLNGELVTEIVIPDGVTKINDGAFVGCGQLEKITIGNGVKSIGEYAFADCRLSSIIIGDGINSIGPYAFDDCYSLNTTYFVGTKAQWNNIRIDDGNDNLLNSRIHFNYYKFTHNVYTSEVTKKATCVKEGVMTYTCHCGGGVYTEVIPKSTQHSDVDENYKCDNCGMQLEHELKEVTTGYKREHVVDNWKALNQSYKSEYLAGFAVPMDGTNGNPDYLIPGQSENMIPQGLTYWPEKDWVLVSSYDVNEKNASVIFALDRETGAFVAQFNLKEIKNGSNVDCIIHAGGIGVSEHNLYITYKNDRIGYFSLKDLDVPNGTVKDIVCVETIGLAQLSGTHSAYVNVSDGILWAGNFHSASPGSEELAELGAIPKSWTWKANEDYYSAILGFRLSGNTSEEEWNNLVAIKDNANHIINVNNSIDCIQGIAFKKLDDNRYMMYLSRTTDASFGASISTAVVNLDNKVVEVDNIKRFTLNKNLPGTEGIVLIGDDLHILYESAALSKSGKIGNEIIWNQHLKNCTDVIWKINESNMLCTPTFDSDSFKNDSNKYNHKLAKFCSSFICVGYNYKDIEWISDTLTDAGMNADKKFIDTNVGQNGVNNIISHKEINVNGKTYTLIFVAAIGSHKKQWYSNFDPGTSTTHRGFIYAKNHVNLQLAKYIQKYNLHDVENTKILLTGHSRGAATVNLLAAELIKNQNIAKAENIYTYGFATPNTTSLPERNEEKFERIFNIVNPEDFVTKVVPTKWEYGRYGTTYTLPSKFNSGRGYVDGEYVNLYSEYFLPRMKKVFLQVQDEEYEPYPVGEATVYGLMKKLTDEVTSLTNYYDKELRLDYKNKMTPYYLFQSVLCPIVAKDDKDAEKLAYAWASDILTMPGSSDLYQDIIEFFVVNQGVSPKFEHSHLMKTYYSYMMTMTEDEITETRKPYAYKENAVNCPVDIEVYDVDAKEVVGRIVDNIIDEEVAKGDFAIYMEVNGDSKMFHLPDCGNYIVKLTGNGVGTMDYTISEINSDFEEVTRVNFFDVEITDGLTMIADVEAEEFIIEEHELTFENGETLDPTEIFVDEDIETYNIEISTSGGGSASSSQTVKSGDYVSLDAVAEDGWKFIGWYENNKLISAETILAFVAKSDRSLEAKFEHVDHSFGDWYEVTPATCEKEGLEQRDCSACDYSETQQIPATGHNYNNGVCTSCCDDLTAICSCNCHAGGIKRLIFKIILFFQKLFRMNQICEGCGVYHY